MQIIRSAATKNGDTAALILQLGDLSEGLAGTPSKARDMASHVMAAIEECSYPGPVAAGKRES